MAIRRSLAVRGWPSVVYPVALALAALLPFSAIPPIISTPWLALTDDKLVFLALLAAWLVLGRRAVPTLGEWRLLLPTLVFVLVTLLSARLAAPDYAEEARTYVSRLLAAAFVMLVALRLTGQAPTCANGLIWAVALGGGVSGMLGLGEALRWPALEPVLGLFKVAPTRVGGELRVGASFQYATIASMYFESVAPLAIVLAATARRGWVQILAAAIGVVCTLNVVLSLTRAGMLTLACIFALLVLSTVVFRGWRRVLMPTLVSGVVLVGGASLLLLHDPVFDLRLVSESDADWYGAVYSAPPTLNLQAGQAATVDLDVQNEGRITWTTAGNHPFALGYRWLTDDGTGVLDIPPLEVPLTHDVQPGETIHLQAMVDVPDLPAGTYRLDWGMLQRDVLEFYERGWADAETAVSVEQGRTASVVPPVQARDDAEAPWVVGRIDLWSAAIKLFAAHPVLGLGPDNFRHYYGAEFGLEAWDERVQANNLYLEILADLGVLGLIAFAWVVLGPLRKLIDALAVGGATPAYLGLGIALAVMAFLLHGLLDTFLAFTPTALLFWLLLGVAQSQGPAGVTTPASGPDQGSPAGGPPTR